jgi:hypothetical protein
VVHLFEANACQQAHVDVGSKRNILSTHFSRCLPASIEHSSPHLLGLLPACYGVCMLTRRCTYFKENACQQAPAVVGHICNMQLTHFSGCFPASSKHSSPPFLILPPACYGVCMPTWWCTCFKENACQQARAVRCTCENCGPRSASASTQAFCHSCLLVLLPACYGVCMLLRCVRSKA